MQVTVVGCAGSFPGPDSPASCYLVEADGFRLVLDLGNGALGALQSHLALTDVDAVYLSHLHADHCIDMLGYSVFQNYHPGGQRPRIRAYGPEGSAVRLRQALGPGSGKGIADAFDFTALAPGKIQIGPLEVTVARMRHPVATFGARLEHAGRTLAYSADTGPSEELVELARDADLLLAEASFLDAPDLPPDLHLTARQAAEHAAKAGGELVLTHLVAWNDPAVSQAQAAEAYHGPIRLAASGMRLFGD